MITLDEKEQKLVIRLINDVTFPVSMTYEERDVMVYLSKKINANLKKNKYEK